LKGNRRRNNNTLKNYRNREEEGEEANEWRQTMRKRLAEQRGEKPVIVSFHHLLLQLGMGAYFENRKGEKR
jgi:hypothetical protein